MNSQDMITQRLSSQLLSRTGTSVHAAVAHMAATQAQDYYGALWSIGLRTGLTEAQVIEAIEARQIVRTWPQRGTLHYVAAEDVGWMTALSAPRLLRAATRRHADLGLDTEVLEKSKQLFGQALKNGKTLTRPQMIDLLEGNAIQTLTGRGYHILWFAAQTGQLYVGPMSDKQQTFGLVENLPVAQRQLNREESVAELAQRYFIARGPATIQDFMWWSGLTAADAKVGLAANAGALISQQYDGREYWCSVAVEPAPVTPKALLLAGFDEYILGYKDRANHITAE
jgi:hypothetical protein